MYYNVHYEAGSIHSKWTTSNKSEDILYKFENNPVIGVRELNTNSGYLLVDSLDDLDTLESAGYFHDVISRNLYIKTSDADTISTVDENNCDNDEVNI